MKYRIVLNADSPEAVTKALGKVKHQVVLVSLDQSSKPGAQEAPVARSIYEQLCEGVTYGRIAERVGVSYHTVLRLAKNPRKYGIDAEPIARKGVKHESVSRLD